MTANKYATAKQVYEEYGIPRSALRSLVDAGRVRCDTIKADGFVLNRYYREDIEKLEGGADRG